MSYLDPSKLLRVVVTEARNTGSDVPKSSVIP